MPNKLSQETVIERLAALGHELLSPYTKVLDDHLIRFAGCGCEYEVKLNVLQIGITNVATKRDRIKDHARSGWDLITKWEYPKGQTAYDLKQAVIKSWRKRGFEIAASEADTPHGGYTETVRANQVSVEEIIELAAA
jgi:hypothetical protein